MKKKWGIAISLLALTGSSASFAQSNVTVSGIVDLGVGRFTGNGTGVNANDKAATRVENGGMTFSRLVFAGSEDLGKGNSVSFELSTFIRADTGAAGRADAIGAPLNLGADPLFARASWIGFTNSDYGRIRLGNATTLLFINAINSNAFGDSTVYSPLILTTFVGGPLSGGTGWNNQVVYNSPIISGFSVWAAATASEGLGRNRALRGVYGNGPLNASVVWQDVQKTPQTFADGTTLTHTRTWLAAASYDFGFVKVYGNLGQIVNRGTDAAPLDVHYKLAEVSASVPAGAGAFLVGYAQRKTDDPVAPVPGGAPAGNIERKVFTLGYDYFLSKRTDMYAMAMRDSTQTNTLPGATVKAHATNFGVGIRHRF